MCSIAVAGHPTASLSRADGIGTPKPGARWWRRGEFRSTLSPQSSWSAMKFVCLAGLGLRPQVQRRLHKCLARRVLVLSSSEFDHLFEEGPTELTYAGTPVSGLRQTQQGRMCKEWVQKVLQKQNPTVEILDPKPETRCNGIKRGRNQATYDFLLDSRKVKVKSSRIVWRSTSRGGCWTVEFARVKLAYKERTEAAFDDLYLVIVSPRGLHVIKHDLATRVGAPGKLTVVYGHTIKVSSSAGTHCWEDALKDILWKLCEQGGCSVVIDRPFSDPDVKSEVKNAVASRAQAAVAGIPMCSMSSEKRGKRMKDIGFAIDSRLNPHGKFLFSEGTGGKSNAPADWVRDMVRVELKSCGLTFHRSTKQWLSRFAHIKPDLFDELWLAIYTSVGISYYKCTLWTRLALIKAGVGTKIDGYGLRFYGPCGELDPLDAFKVIEAKMISSGCELVAIIEWEKGASMSHTSLELVAEPTKGAAGVS